jgi:hypothetical protein
MLHPGLHRLILLVGLVDDIGINTLRQALIEVLDLPE